MTVLQIAYQLKYTIFGLSRRLFLLVPVRDRSTQINSLHLLDEGTNHLVVIVPNGSHPNKVHINDADDVLASNASVLFRELFIALPRDKKLIFASLAAVDMIVSVKERSIVNHEGHLKALMHDLEVTIPVDRRG